MTLHTPIGSYLTHEEFQVESTIVSIRVPDNGARQTWIAQGKTLYGDAASWTASVIAIATACARTVHDGNSSLTDSDFCGLKLRGVWIDPEDRSILFDVYDANERLPMASNDPMHGDVFSVNIKLTAGGELNILPESGV